MAITYLTQRRDKFGRFLVEATEEMKNYSALQAIREILKGKGKEPINPADALNWYRTALRQLGGINATTLLQDRKNLGGGAFIGKMFFFQYDPKWKKKLPYYDTFPLVIPISILDDGILGLNLHYLPYIERATLFEKLLDFATDKRLNSKTRLEVTYGMLKGVAKYMEHTPCIKRYLNNHIVSKILKMDAPYWKIALYLPVENFKKQPKTTVWKKSMAKISASSDEDDME